MIIHEDSPTTTADDDENDDDAKAMTRNACLERTVVEVLVRHEIE